MRTKHEMKVVRTWSSATDMVMMWGKKMQEEMCGKGRGEPGKRPGSHCPKR